MGGDCAKAILNTKLFATYRKELLSPNHVLLEVCSRLNCFIVSLSGPLNVAGLFVLFTAIIIVVASCYAFSRAWMWRVAGGKICHDLDQSSNMFSCTSTKTIGNDRTVASGS